MSDLIKVGRTQLIATVYGSLKVMGDIISTSLTDLEQTNEYVTAGLIQLGLTNSNQYIPRI